MVLLWNLSPPIIDVSIHTMKCIGLFTIYLCAVITHKITMAILDSSTHVPLKMLNLNIIIFQFEITKMQLLLYNCERMCMHHVLGCPNLATPLEHAVPNLYTKWLHAEHFKLQ